VVGINKYSGKGYDNKGNMKNGNLVSIIIPNFNSSKTISKCLDAIFSSDYKNFEIIIVDDKSTDNCLETIKNYPVRLIKNKKNLGAAYSRNAGAKSAKGEILVFIDSDVVVKKDTLGRILDDFKKMPYIGAVQTIYSHKCRFKNPSSQYKAMYNHYSFSCNKSKFIPTIASYCSAVKKKVFDKIGGFDANMIKSYSEDDEFGYRLVAHNYKIYFDKSIEVEHLAYFSMKKTLKRDFKMGKDAIKTLLRNKNKEFVNLANKKQFATNINLNVILSILLSLPLMLSLIILMFYPNAYSFVFFLLLNIMMVIINLKFLFFILSKKNVFYMATGYFIHLLSMMFVALGIIFGIFEFALGRRY